MKTVHDIATKKFLKVNIVLLTKSQRPIFILFDHRIGL